MIVIRYGKGRESIDQVMVTYRYSVTNQSNTQVRAGIVLEPIGFSFEVCFPIPLSHRLT